MIPNIGTIYRRKWNNKLNKLRQGWNIQMEQGIKQLEEEDKKPKKIIV